MKVAGAIAIGFILLVGAALGLVGLVGTLISRGADTPAETAEPKRPDEAEREPKAEHSKVEAYVFCKMLVRNQLKAPATARFPREAYSDVTLDLGEGWYTVRSYVEAQNSFGAMIRSHYECTVQWVGRKRYEVIHFEME